MIAYDISMYAIVTLTILGLSVDGHHAAMSQCPDQGDHLRTVPGRCDIVVHVTIHGQSLTDHPGTVHGSVTLRPCTPVSQYPRTP